MDRVDRHGMEGGGGTGLGKGRLQGKGVGKVLFWAEDELQECFEGGRVRTVV